MFPTEQQENFGIAVTGIGAAMDFSVLLVPSFSDVSIFAAQTNGQLFPRYTYEPRGEQSSLFDDAEPYTRVDNITDEILTEYQGLYGSEVEKDDIFYFVYGLLHSPDYRTTYAADLKKMLPRIPVLADAHDPAASDFWEFTGAGRDLAELHLDYEDVEPYPLDGGPAGNAPSPAGRGGRVDERQLPAVDQAGQPALAPTTTARNDRAPAQHRSPPRQPALAAPQPAIGRLSGEP